MIKAKYFILLLISLTFIGCSSNVEVNTGNMNFNSDITTEEVKNNLANKKDEINDKVLEEDQKEIVKYILKYEDLSEEDKSSLYLKIGKQVAKQLGVNVEDIPTENIDTILQSLCSYGAVYIEANENGEYNINIDSQYIKNAIGGMIKN